jgi:hypothetical protein
MDSQSFMTEICWKEKHIITSFIKTAKQHFMGFLILSKGFFHAVSSTDIIKRWLYKLFKTDLGVVQ